MTWYATHQHNGQTYVGRAEDCNGHHADPSPVTTARDADSDRLRAYVTAPDHEIDA